MLNNFVIDYAKTLFLPDTPKEKEQILKQFTNNKVPHFFIYAKDKEKHQVEKINSSTVNKLNDLIKNNPIRFNATVGKMNYKHLMNDVSVEIDESIINKYIELNKNKRIWIDKDSKSGGYHFDKMLRDELLLLNNDETYVTDTLIKYLYEVDSKYKSALWDCFGETVYGNLYKSIGHTIQCDVCNKRFKYSEVNEKYCINCKRKRTLESKRKWKNGRKS